MEIVSIFEDYLYAVRYQDKEQDEFERLFDLWQDVEQLEVFFVENKDDLQGGFYGTVTIEEAILQTRKDAHLLEEKIITLLESGTWEAVESLDTLFKPLNNQQYRDTALQKSKARSQRKKCWLRIYVIKIDEHLYVITGGAIKLTATMQERAHTQKELQKIERCRSYLLEEGVMDGEAFKELEI